VHYEARVEAVRLENGFCRGVTTRLAEFGARDFSGRSVVFASGGFQANIPWLKESWGAAADNFLIRGTPYNTGEVLKQLLDQGTAQVGDPQQCHAVAIDGRAPKYDGGICTRVDCVSLGIVVNEKAERFYDEGEDFWPKRYAIWGRLVAKQPDQIAYSIIDSKAEELFLPPLYPPVRSETIEGLAEALGLAPSALRATVDAYNATCAAEGPFDTTIHDGRRTKGLTPDKTNWARPIDRPPYIGFPLRPGITFTYLGVRVTEDAAAVIGGKPASNIYAAGEIMAGNVLGQGYLAGIGMTIGSVFGRRAGKGAARHAGN